MEKNKLQIMYHSLKQNRINLSKHVKKNLKEYIKLLEGLKEGRETMDCYIVRIFLS